MITLSLTIGKIIWLALLLLIPGALTLLAALKGKKILSVRGWGEFIFFSFLGGFALLSILGLITAQLGVFSIQLISGLLFIYSLLILIIYRPEVDSISDYLSRDDLPNRGRIEKSTPLILLFILFIAGILFLRPTEYIFGGWDPGVYINTAIHIERTGAIVIDDPQPEYYSPGEWASYSRRHSSGYSEKYPGFRRAGPEGNRLLPQFYHLFPVLLAISYLPAGMGSIFYLTPILGLLSLLAIYLAVSELMDRKVALLSVFLIAVNMAEIWQARSPVTEILSQFLLFSGLFLLTRFLKKGEAYPGWLAGTIFGILILSRISALLIFLPLAIFFYCGWFISYRKKDLHFILPLLALTAYSLLSGIFFGGHYIKSAFNNFLGAGSIWLWFIPVGIAGAFRLSPKRRREILARLFNRRGLRWTACAIIIALVCFGYFIRPYDPSMSADRTNLVELGWLLTLPGLGLSIAGICLLILKNRGAAIWAFILVILAFAIVFLCRQLIHVNYMWAARRYMVVVVPGFIICAAWFIARLGRVRFPAVRWMAVIIFLLVAGMEVHDGRALFTHREYRGAVDFMDRIADIVRDGDLILVEGESIDKLPTTLHMIYGFSVLPLYSPGPERETVISDLIRRLKKNEEAGKKFPIVYLITDKDPPVIPGAGIRLIDEISYHATLFERSGIHLPCSLDDHARDGNIKVKIFRLLPE